MKYPTEINVNLERAEQCYKCRFWEPMWQGALNGECRFNPPDPAGDWPSTTMDKWCGKFEPNKQRTA